MKKVLLFFFVLLASASFAQVSPQITGAGAPTNPCLNGGQQYLDTTGHNIYVCPSNGSNWVNIGIGNAAATVTSGNGAPTNPCAGNQLWVNSSNGNFYTCNNGSWAQLSGSGGTVTTTGSPANGNLTKFSGTSSITNTNLSGDATTSNTSAVTVVALNGTNLAGLGTGILKNTTGTGVPSIAVGTDLPTSIPIGSVGTAGLSGTAPVTISAAGAIACSTCVVNNGANTAAAAMTLDMSAATGGTALKVPVIAGATAGADGVIDYDSTNKNTHIRMNGADAIAAAEASALGVGAIPKSPSATLGQLAASSITDNGTLVATPEVLKIGTAGGNPHQNLTIGSNTTAMGSQSSASCTNITGMTWTINASKNYHLMCAIPRTLAASATLQYCLGGPGTPTSYNIVVTGLNGASSAWSQSELDGQTTYGTKTTAQTANANTATDHVEAFIQNGATASGTALTLQTAANGTNNITVNANAVCELWQVN